MARLRRATGYQSSLRDANPPLLTDDRLPWNERAFHAAEIPAVNAIGTARSIARLYEELVRDGGLLRPETVRLARTPLSEGPCALTGHPYAFGIGFELQTELGTFGPPADAFGHYSKANALRLKSQPYRHREITKIVDRCIGAFTADAFARPIDPKGGLKGYVIILGFGPGGSTYAASVFSPDQAYEVQVMLSLSSNSLAIRLSKML